MYQRVIAVLCFLSIIIFAISCNSTSPTTTAIPKVELRQEWFPYAGFAGEVSAAKRFAKDQQIELKIVPGSEEVDPIKLVLSSSADFGVVGGDLLVAAVAKGAPLVAIGVINYKSPTCFLVRANSGIKSPADFIGKRVGILAGTNTERIYQLMMKRSNIDRSKVTEVQAPFDLQTFILGEYDVRPAFIYDEPVSLEMKSVPYEVIDPTKYGVNFMGTVYFTRREVVEKNPELVQKVINSLAKGWTFALNTPDAAIGDLVSTFSDLKSDREQRSLVLAKPYFAGENGKPLEASTQTWESMIKGLEEINVIPQNSVKVEQVWNNTFIRRVYE